MDSKEYLVKSKRDEVILDVSKLETNPVCRICHSSSENLIKPCECKGTIEHVHRHCLERWLEERNMDSCELCSHTFQTRRTKKSFREMLEDRQIRKYVAVYCSFMAIAISPLIAAAWMLWISTEAFVYYIQKYGWSVYTASSIFLPFVLGLGVMVCLSMMIIFTRDLIKEFVNWRNRNWNVRVVEGPHSDLITDRNIEISETISRNPTQDLTVVTQQPVIRYIRDLNEADYVTIIDFDALENDNTRQRY